MPRLVGLDSEFGVKEMSRKRCAGADGADLVYLASAVGCAAIMSKSLTHKTTWPS